MQPINMFNIISSNFILTFHHLPYRHTENVLVRLQRQFILAAEEKAAMTDTSNDEDDEDEEQKDNDNEQEDNGMTRSASHAPIVPTWVNYALLDDVTDGFAPVMNQLQMEVDSMDELVLVLRQSEQTDMLRRLGETRRRVMAVGRLLNTKPDVVRSLIKWRQGLTEETGQQQQQHDHHQRDEKITDIDAYLSDILGRYTFYYM
jgi:Mg2+ and Co2+ transporter CorA